MEKGWIKLHRAIAEHPRFTDAKWLQIWIKCMVLATHKAYKTVFDGKVIELQPGQFITSRKSLAKETDTQESKVERILKTLEIEQQIEQVGGATSRLITVTNWDGYQGSEQDDEQRMNNDRTTNEQRVNTNKNGKNTKNGKKKIKTGEVVDSDLLPPSPDPENLEATKDTLKAAVACALLENPEFSIAWSAFLEMRRGLKFPAGDLAQERLLKKLETYPVETAIKMVDESTMNSWRGVFPLKEQNNGTGKNFGSGQRGAFGSPGTAGARAAERRDAKAAGEFAESLQL